MITEVIEKLLREDPYFSTLEPQQINNGNCEDFSLAVEELVKGAISRWGDEWLGSLRGQGNIDLGLSERLSLAHAFIEYKQRFYDCEAPQGVDNPFDLPFFQRYGGRKVYETYLTTNPMYVTLS